MKSTLIENPAKASLDREAYWKNVAEYPCLGIITAGFVVLFNAPGEGTVVYVSSSYNKGSGMWKVGDHFKAWGMLYFEPCDGRVILEN